MHDGGWGEWLWGRQVCVLGFSGSAMWLRLRGETSPCIGRETRDDLAQAHACMCRVDLLDLQSQDQDGCSSGRIEISQTCQPTFLPILSLASSAKMAHLGIAKRVHFRALRYTSVEAMPPNCQSQVLPRLFQAAVCAAACSPHVFFLEDETAWRRCLVTKRLHSHVET